MATQINWQELCDACYPSFKLEVNAFLDSLDVSNSTEISMEFIYNIIKSDGQVPDNLKLLYQEAIFGSNVKVRNRIKNRVSHFHRSLK